MSLRGEKALDRPDGHRLVAVHARLNAVLWDLFELVGELDTDEARFRNAMTDAVSWLRFDLGISARTARAWVRAAGALVDLPVIAEAFRVGDVSLDEVLVLVRYATPANEARLVGLTREVGVEELAAEIRAVLDTPVPEKPESAGPMLRTWWDEHTLHVRGQIPGADGVLVETTLMRLAALAPVDPQSGLFRSTEQREGEALVQLASEATAADRNHDQATVVVHITLDELTTADPDQVFNVGGSEYNAAELLRLCCDGRIQPAIDHQGVTVGVGRVTRQIPAWLRRVLINRDQGCRFPACRRTRWTHAHHLVHWAHGGPTNLDNLITLCGFHHRLIHNQGWQLQGNPNGTVTFINHHGTPHQPTRRFPPHWHTTLAHQIDTVYQPAKLKQHANAPP